MTKRNARYEHNRQVFEFLRLMRKNDPDKYYEVVRKYPVISFKKLQQIQRNETLVCDLGERREE